MNYVPERTTQRWFVEFNSGILVLEDKPTDCNFFFQSLLNEVINSILGSTDR